MLPTKIFLPSLRSVATYDTLKPIFKPLDCLLLVDPMRSANLGLTPSPFRNTFPGASPKTRSQPFLTLEKSDINGIQLTCSNKSPFRKYLWQGRT